MEQRFAVLINGNPRSTNSQGGIRTYKTRERARKENQRYKLSGWKDVKVQIVEVVFKDIEDL